ncbi:MAG: RluA family pseudouridine synthase, partial [Bacillota bacterium]|nr:RluA family pseudouridine synthase [Bacillota bacterium]
MIKIEISGNDSGQRLDRFLKKYLKRAPLSTIYKTIRKDLKLNGKRAKEDTILNEGDEISLYLSEDRIKKLTAPVKSRKAKKQFKVAYEDEEVLIVEKPWGLLTHGDSHEKKNTLMNQVCGYLQDKGEYNPSSERTFTPSPVNRLDRNTTGLVIFGKTAEALRQLTKLIRLRDGISKFYITIVAGD